MTLVERRTRSFGVDPGQKGMHDEAAVREPYASGRRWNARVVTVISRSESRPSEPYLIFEVTK